MSQSILITLFLLFILEGSSLIRHCSRPFLQQQQPPHGLYDVLHTDEPWAGIRTPSNTIVANEVDTARAMVQKYQIGNKPTPSEELLRFEAYTRLRQRMYELIRKEGCDSRRGWVRAFERWQYSAKTFEFEEATKKETSQTMIDPLIPSGWSNNPADTLLLEDLSRLDNLSVDGAQRTAVTIAADAKRLSQALAARRLMIIDKTTSMNDGTSVNMSNQRRVWTQSPQTSPSPSSSSTSNLWNPAASSSLVEFSQNDINGDLKLRLRAGDAHSKQLRVFAISASHTDKLYTMWRKTNHHDHDHPQTNQQDQNNDNNVDGVEVGENIRPATFYEDLFCLLVRYAALEGKGWQAAIPHTVLPTLQNLFGVSVECFSSPLNCYLPWYCSLFPDVDGPFGSLGSFFDHWTPSCGSFEANPPFIPQLMVRMTRRMEMLLKQASGPMSFVVVVPAWKEDAHWSLLINSPFYHGHFVLDASDHSYCDGFQHESTLSSSSTGSLYRPAPFDTALFFLQNDAGHMVPNLIITYPTLTQQNTMSGRKQWPLTTESEASLRNAFALARPSVELLEKQAARGLYIPKHKR